MVRVTEVRMAWGSRGRMLIGTDTIVQLDCPARRTGTVQESTHGASLPAL